MSKSFFPGLEILVMGTKDIMREYPKARSVLLKVCRDVNDKDISDAEFRSMIHNLMCKKVELMEDRMPPIRIS